MSSLTCCLVTRNNFVESVILKIYFFNDRCFIKAIEEANHISIALDKKVVFAALPVTAQARGDSDSKIKPYVSVRNFAEGLEWIWTKEKFFTRKHDITEIYDDFMDDGHINRDKFKVKECIFFAKKKINLKNFNSFFFLY